MLGGRKRPGHGETMSSFSRGGERCKMGGGAKGKGKKFIKARCTDRRTTNRKLEAI